MNEKKFLIIALIAYAALVFVCWDDSVSTSPDGKAILTFWHTYNDEEETVLREIIKKWEALSENAKFTVRPVRIPFDGHKSKIRTALTVGQGPDMARVDWSFVCELAKKNSVVNLGEMGFDSIKNNYLQGPLESATINGQAYGIPDQSTCFALFYNKRLFKEAGFENPDEALPKTWQEFIEVGKKLSDGKDRYAFAFQNSLWRDLPFFNTYGARVISSDGKKCLLDSPKAIEALKMMCEIVNSKIEANAWRPGAIEPEQGFVNNKYAMIFMGPWNLAKFDNTNIDYGVGLIPAGPHGTSTNIGGTDVVIFNHTQYAKKCYEFLAFFTNAENQKDWCTSLNQLPINLKAYDLVSFKNEKLKVFMTQMKSALVNPVVKDFGLLEDIVNPEIEAALSGQKTPEQALKAASEKVQKRLLDS